ncbi:hypothetical protein NGM10_11985 [Halorussus salilacus]|uniref:hypothetical protein n=1 Tax=Halorussus salilacus TaxID=2953750 RepID=UPI0020A054DF|nr:hypothetical protein [Halorussus salilacus]USZ67445.1 hypothetical protein NGM10_11985 [Halorussus salilacus]
MLDPLHLLVLGVVLLVTLAVGVFVHELLHVVPLSLVDATYTVTVLPSDDAGPTASGTLGHAVTGGLVSVEVERVPSSAPVWVVRGAALAPLALALPLALVLAGVLPDPLATGDRAGTVALVALTACALPSPGDWAVACRARELYRRE